MIKPINSHVLIEPIVNDAFMASQSGTYQEVGVVIDVDAPLKDHIKTGDKVYFDSWMAAKFPKEGTTDEYYWLVKHEDIRAIEVVA